MSPLRNGPGDAAQVRATSFENPWGGAPPPVVPSTFYDSVSARTMAALRALAMPLRALAMPIRVLAIQAQATCALPMDNKAGREPGMLVHE